MKTIFAAVLGLMLLPAFAMADWHGGGRYGGYHGGFGGYHGYHDYHGGGWHGGGHGLFDFSLGFGGYYGGYYPSYGYESYSTTYYPPVVSSAPAVTYDYYGAPVYSSAPVVVSPAPVITRTYVSPPPVVTYSRPYYYGGYGPTFNVGGRFYFGHR